MKLEVVDSCEYCEAERISREDCSKHFGHGHETLCCVDCCCYSGDVCEDCDEA